MLGFQDLMEFGKYKGVTIEEVYNEDPEYLIWAFHNKEGFVSSLSENVLRKLEKLED